MNIKQIIKLMIALCLIDEEEFNELKHKTAQQKKKEHYQRSRKKESRKRIINHIKDM